jgi:hypothetical protein
MGFSAPTDGINRDGSAGLPTILGRSPVGQQESLAPLTAAGQNGLTWIFPGNHWGFGLQFHFQSI